MKMSFEKNGSTMRHALFLTVHCPIDQRNAFIVTMKTISPLLNGARKSIHLIK